MQVTAAPSSMPVWMDDVSCKGIEQSLALCSHAGLGHGNCGHSEDVKIRCKKKRGLLTAYSSQIKNLKNVYIKKYKSSYKGSVVAVPFFHTSVTNMKT